MPRTVRDYSADLSRYKVTQFERTRYKVVDDRVSRYCHPLGRINVPCAAGMTCIRQNYGTDLYRSKVQDKE